MSVLIALHAAGATLALLLGAVMIGHRPRGDAMHRRLGRVWFVAMYWVVLSSFGIKRLTPGHFSWIHGLSLFTFCTLTLALYGARTHNVKLHRGNVVGSYFGLVGAGIAASAFPARAIPRLAVTQPIALVAAVIVLAGLASVLVHWAKQSTPRTASSADRSSGSGLDRHLRMRRLAEGPSEHRLERRLVGTHER